MIVLETKSKRRYNISPTREVGETQMLCPVCSAERKKKNQKCMSWNADKGTGICHHCGATFSSKTEFRTSKPKTYAVPRWENKTELSDEAVEYLEGRMISQETMRKAQIYSAREWMPQYNAEVKVICFPYFVDGKCVNIKYRGPEKTFKLYKDAELVFYNLDAVKDASEVIICEGEMDALTFMECGFPNVISVPNGATANNLPYLDNYADRFENVSTFYIAADFDDAGEKLRQELVRRLGFEKCRIVTYHGRKDANELLCKEGGQQIRKVLEESKAAPIGGSLTVHDILPDIWELYEHGYPSGMKIGIPEIDDVFVFHPGQLAIWTGIPGHGKSEVIDFFTVRLAVMHDWKTLYFSPENHPTAYHYSKIVSKLSGKEFNIMELSEPEFNESLDYLGRHIFWLDASIEPTLESIMERAEQYVRHKGIRQLVIDPFNCLEHTRQKDETQTDYIGRFLDTLQRFARNYDVMVHLVAHPAKLMEKNRENDYSAPSLYDISGSANFYNKCDYGISVFRDANDFTTIFPLKVRHAYFGHRKRDGIILRFNRGNGRYQPFHDDVNEPFDNTNWIPIDADTVLLQPSPQPMMEPEPVTDYEPEFEPETPRKPAPISPIIEMKGFWESYTPPPTDPGIISRVKARHEERLRREGRLY